MRVFKEKPLSSITLRRFEKPGENLRENIRKFCISIGLLQPGDSRDIIVDILEILLKKRNEKEIITADEISKLINKRGNTLVNIRRQLRRLIEIGIAEKINKGYRITEFLSLEEVMKKIQRYSIEPTIERIVEYARKIDSELIK